MNSLLFLTLHKTASTFVARRLLPSIAEAMRFTHINPERNQWTAGGERRRVTLDALASQESCIVGPVRDPGTIRDAAAFDGWRKILLLRDPRDMLTSLYYSVALSHRRPPDGPAAQRFDDRRRTAQAMTVDEFVRDVSARRDSYYVRYTDYLKRFAGRPNLLLLRYENMVEDWRGFLGHVADYCAIEPRSAWLAQMAPLEQEFSVLREDPTAHKRQVTPGDAFRKLQPETIEILNAKFAEILAWIEPARINNGALAAATASSPSGQPV